MGYTVREWSSDRINPIQTNAPPYHVCVSIANKLQMYKYSCIHKFMYVIRIQLYPGVVRIHMHNTAPGPPIDKKLMSVDQEIVTDIM